MKIALLPLITSPDGTENAVVVTGDGDAKRVNLLAWATAQLASAKTAALAAITAAQTTATTAINALITTAQGYATAAANSATAAATSAGSVPTGAATYIEAHGPPGSNIGTSGAFYFDLDSSYLYGPKTAAGWPAGALAARGAIPSATRVRVDLRIPNATIPANHITCTRNSTSTDMMPYDAYTYSYNSFAINTPVLKPGKGLIGSGARAQQLLNNPTAPMSETVTVPSNSVVCVTAFGPAGSTYGVAAGATGGAIGTGFGTMAGDGGKALFLTITTGGTITLSPTGITKANVQYNPSLPSGTEVVPFIPTQSTREADIIAAGSVLLPAFQSPQGYFLMGISNSLIRSYGSPPTFLGFNNSAAIFPTSATGFNLLDSGAAATPVTTGSGSFNTSATIGFTWDTTPTVTIGGGDKLEVSRGFRLNNNVAITSVSLLGSKTTTNTSGQQGASACLAWYEYDTTARLSDEALYAAYTSFKLPTIDDFLKNYDGAPQFPKFLDAMRQMALGTIDHVRVVDFGSSHHAGTSSVSSNVRASGTTAQMVADLQAEGCSVTDDFFTGPQSYTWSGGVCPFDSRLTYTGPAPTSVLNQTGVVVIRLQAGTVLNFAPKLNSAQFRLAYYLGAGYGSLEVSKDGGTTAIIPVEGGSATIATAGTSAIAVNNFTAALGANVWSMKASGASVDLSFGYAYNPAAKQVVFGNMACYGYSTAGLSLDSSPEQSVLLPLRTYAPHLSFGFNDDTNSMSQAGAPLTQSAYASAGNTILASLQVTADVIDYTDPPSDLSFVSQATQNTIYGYNRKLARDNYLPIFDFAGWVQTYLRLPNGSYDDNKHLTKRMVKRLKSNQQKALYKRILALV
jgi:hypothetical protein